MRARAGSYSRGMSAGLLVIGSGAAGSAAARAYRGHSAAPVRIITRDQDLPYDRPPLSKDFLRGEVDEADIALEDPGFYAAHDIEVTLRRSVESVDVEARTVRLDDGSDVGYEQLVIATGASPTSLPVPGGDADHVRQLRSLAHARDLRAVGPSRSVIVIGSGFIGCEAASSLRQRGAAVTLVTNEPSPQQARLGRDAAHRIARWLTDEGVALVVDAQITGIGRRGDDEADGGDGTDDGAVQVQIAGHEPISAEFVLVAAGVAPNGDFGPALGAIDGRIVVDSHMRTNRGDVFAAGDMAAAHNVTAARQVVVEHWGDAEAMGEIAGANAAGQDREWGAVPGFWSEIGEHTLKYHAWGDGFDDVRFVARAGGGFTSWYLKDDRIVGVLTSDADDDYDRGEKLVADGAPSSAIDTASTDTAGPGVNRQES